MTDDEKKPFKLWFDRSAAQALGRQIGRAWPEWDQERFVAQATEGLDALEFHARVKQFSNALRQTLPASIPEALAILTRSLPAPQTDCETITDGWLQWPVGQFIADHAVEELDAAFEAMIALTQCFSSEFAIRPFAERYPEEVIARLLELTSHPNPHVRRWCSEGVRPRLPWGRQLKALIADPTPTLPLLERLKDDPELYVRRSVANHLNDIAKDHPELVVAIARRWFSSNASPERQWIIRHALRTLVKDGHPGALDVMGFGPVAGLEAALRLSSPRAVVGESLVLELTLSHPGQTPRPVVVDYIVHYVRQRGQTNAKVFKWKHFELAGETSVELSKKHSLRETTIRALYPGEHRIEVQVNGQIAAAGSFHLAQA